MVGETPRVTVERVDYGTSLRLTRLFNCFRMAVHPSRLLLGLLLIVLLFITGWVMDAVAGKVVQPGEFEKFVASPAAEFNAWYNDPLRAGTRPELKDGVFWKSLELGVRYFDSLVQSSISLRPGFDQFSPGARPDTTTMLGSLRYMAYIPLWLWRAHFWFFLVYLTIAMLLWSLLGGAISRQTTVEAANDRIVPATEAVGYALRRWGWYLLAPSIAPLIVIALGVLLAAVSLLFYVPALNILAALAFIVMLGIGFVMALMLVGWIAGWHLMYPSLSAEGTDAFDAMSRSYSYVFARPWRFMGYTLVALVYGAATYLVVGLFVYLTVGLTHWAAGMWVSGFDQLFPSPKFGQLSYSLRADAAAWEALRWDQKATGTVIMVWVHLVIAVLGAYAISYYFSAYSVIYLLLRRYTDGTDMAEVFEPAPAAAPVAAEKVEPAVTAAPATTGTTSV